MMREKRIGRFDRKFEFMRWPWHIRPGSIDNPVIGWKSTYANPTVSGSSDFSTTTDVFGSPSPVVTNGPDMSKFGVWIFVAPTSISYNSHYNSTSSLEGSGAATLRVVLYCGSPYQPLITIYGSEFIAAGNASNYGRYISYGWNPSFTGINMACQANDRHYIITPAIDYKAQVPQPGDVNPTVTAIGLWCQTTGCSYSVSAKVSIMWEEVP